MSDNREYVALQPIDHNGVRAYNPGDRVPAANVERHGYERGVQVAEVGSKDAQAVTSPSEQAGQSAQEPATDTTESTPTRRGRGGASGAASS